MSQGFSFPPPPPPPPKAAQEWEQSSSPYESQNRGGRGRGRGRGNNDGRGRGRGTHRGNSGQGSGSHLGMGQNMQRNPVPRFNDRNQSHPQNTGNNGLPPGAFVNPNFMNSAQSTQSDSPSRTVAGHKRKLDALRPPQKENSKTGPPTAPNVPSFGSNLIPSNSLPTKPQQSNSKQPAKANALGLTPGPTEAHYSSSDESDENEDDDKDIDEEAMHAELGTKLTFEHNGVPISLSSAADIAAWQLERKRNWPTSARMAEKEVEKRRVGEERKRLLAAAAALERPFASRVVKARKPEIGANNVSTSKENEDAAKQPEIPETELQKQRRLLAEQTAKVDELRKKVAQGEALVLKANSIRESEAAETEETPETGDNINDDVLAVAMPNIEPQPRQIEKADSVTSEESSVVSSDSDSDDDGPPEQTTSKQAPAATADEKRPLCRYFVASGRCRDGDNCRFKHELPDRGSGQRIAAQQQPPKQHAPPKMPTLPASEKKGIFERLLQQEQAEDDRLILQVVKHLGKSGFFA